MAKYGRGLNREAVAAVNADLITEPFSIKDPCEKSEIDAGVHNMAGRNTENDNDP